MIKKLVTYPDERIKITSADVRTFDEALFGLIENMKDTMEVNGADALAAIQIAVPATVVILRQDDGSYLELINPRIIASEGTVSSTEQTLYLGDISATLPRYEKIKLIYQDRNGTQQSMDVDGELAIRIQRKIDYTFGGTFVDKLHKKEQRRVEKEAEANMRHRMKNGESCALEKRAPKRFYRDYFTAGIKTLLLLESLTLFVVFFGNAEELLGSIYRFDTAVTLVLAALIAAYFFMAHYETRRERSCTGCQSGNIIANTFIYAVLAAVLFLMSYFLINPS